MKMVHWQAKVLSALAVILFLVFQIHTVHSITEATLDNCEVCVKFMTKFIEGLDRDSKGDPKKIQEKFKEACKNTKDGNENRFCYMIGGLETSATAILGEMSKPVSWGMPGDKVCMKLWRKDNQICDLRYEKKLDLAKINLKKLKVRELKNLLSSWDEQCKGCTEKSEYVRLVEELMPKYDPEAAAKRAEAKKTEL